MTCLCGKKNWHKSILFKQSKSHGKQTIREEINRKIGKSRKPDLPYKLSIHLENPKLAPPFPSFAKQTQQQHKWWNKI